MFGWFKSKKLPVEDEQAAQKIENFLDPQAVLDKFTAITGIHFKKKESITTSKLIHFCRNHHLYSFDELYSRLQSDSAILEALINVLTVNETYFFRESRQIYFFVEKVSRNKEKVRILCAPGSTGEEPYSIAMALLEGGIPAQRIEIISLDINSDVVALAREGRYNARSLHKTASSVQEKYFIKEDKIFTISDDVKRLVSFYTLNIFDDHLFEMGKFDIIFSRNMLIYFDESTVIRAVERLGRLARSKDTYLFFGHADFVKTPPTLLERYEEGIKFYTIR
ncbi:MAG: CheR family methyltransferase [Sulfuricurvum sp.]|uniref:CheR family methyltransferase n=1 Tax=Sulfuricurvum sp. TaxID=2025608 RepID=UPI0027364488|nr:CheR family methyltransferase [Sulfuricurvum sp.]MDP2850459.1 CheR family methyltransferase [Sulfuricurvum sp.]